MDPVVRRGFVFRPGRQIDGYEHDGGTCFLKTVLVGSDLLKEFPDAKANLEAILWRGLDVTSHFSGKGTAESIAAQIHDVIRTNVIEHGSVLGKDVNLLPANNFRSIFSCDKNPVCRKALLCMPTEHVFGSIEERVRPDLAQQLDLMLPAANLSPGDKQAQYDDIKKALFTANPPAFSREQKAHCYQHGAACPI